MISTLKNIQLTYFTYTSLKACLMLGILSNMYNEKVWIEFYF